MEMSGQLHALTALLPGKESLVPIRWGLGEPWSQAGHSGE